MTDELTQKASSATKWSLVTEVVVKLISPLTQIALAHILAPEAFGVVATVTMVTSFADMLSDAGFRSTSSSTSSGTSLISSEVLTSPL